MLENIFNHENGIIATSFISYGVCLTIHMLGLHLGTRNSTLAELLPNVPSIFLAAGIICYLNHIREAKLYSVRQSLQTLGRKIVYFILELIAMLYAVDFFIYKLWLTILTYLAVYIKHILAFFTFNKTNPDGTQIENHKLEAKILFVTSLIMALTIFLLLMCNGGINLIIEYINDYFVSREQSRGMALTSAEDDLEDDESIPYNIYRLPLAPQKNLMPLKLCKLNLRKLKQNINKQKKRKCIRKKKN